MGERFFTFQQKQQHANEIGGWHCEGFVDKFTPCPGQPLEAHHGTSFSKGGETINTNMFLLCTVCHAILHLVADEPWATNLIMRRMTSDQLDELHKRGF